MKTKRALKYSLRLFLIGLFVLSVKKVSGQQLDANNKTEKSVAYYNNLIRKNPDLTKFINAVLARGGVPKYLRNLAIIESGLDHQQTSSAGAVGLWQFMSYYGKPHGVSADQRTDINKTTKAVVPSLKQAYRKFGNWITVVAAYNTGAGNVEKAMKKAGSRRYTDFKSYLPLETQNHVQKFLNACYATGELQEVLDDYYKRPRSGYKTSAAVSLVKNDSAGSSRANPSKPLPTIASGGSNASPKGRLQSTRINVSYDPGVIASTLKITKQKLLSWNPKLEHNLKQSGESALYLPSTLMIQFNLHKNEILSNSMQKL